MNQPLTDWPSIVAHVGEIADRPDLLKRGAPVPLKYPLLRQELERASSLLKPGQCVEIKHVVSRNTYKNHLRALQQDGRIGGSVQVGVRGLKTGNPLVFLYLPLQSSDSPTS